MISTFKCVALRGRISIPQCVSLYTLGKHPAGEADRLRTAHCRGCVIGEAHARGETPAQWPEGTLIERGSTTPHGHAAQLAATPPARDEDLMTTKTTGRTIEHAGKSLTIEGWARELGVTPTAVRARIGRGWTELEAVSTPKGEVPARLAAAQEAKAEPPPVKVERTKVKKSAAPRPKGASLVTTSDVVAIASALDPVELLTRLGYRTELVGETPAGRLVLVRAGDE